MRTRDRMYLGRIQSVKRHLPRRSSKNCDLQSANADRLKANYSVNVSKMTHGFFITINSMILYFKHIIHFDDFPLNGHPPSSSKLFSWTFRN